MKVAFALLAACSILCAQGSAAPPKATSGGSTTTAILKPNKIKQPAAKPSAQSAHGLMMKNDAGSQTRIVSQDSKLLPPKMVSSKMKSVSAGTARANKVNPSKKRMIDGISSAKMKARPSNISVAPPQALQSATK